MRMGMGTEMQEAENRCRGVGGYCPNASISYS